MNTTVVEATAFKAMRTDLQISMDDVVSAFVSQYENNLFAKKKELTAIIKDYEKTLNDLSKTVLARVTGDSFDAVLPLGLKLTISEGDINWEEGLVFFKLEIKSSEKQSSYYHNSIVLSKSKAIPGPLSKKRKKAQSKLGTLRSELSEILVSLKSVTRKERQVRGRIALRKLEDSGYSDLMQDKDLIKLVQLDE